MKIKLIILGIIIVLFTSLSFADILDVKVTNNRVEIIYKFCERYWLSEGMGYSFQPCSVYKDIYEAQGDSLVYIGRMDGEYFTPKYEYQPEQYKFPEDGEIYNPEDKIHRFGFDGDDILRFFPDSLIWESDDEN